ncbi:MAG: dihydropteroate synthase [Candidatus Muproteobacteria bacterium RIFCSPHIGHO2_12_FULL_60_33]|uniref:Dihydropteroate synthase n=1 Tax=Candidatus Muproteobacteria bacterium RIFCSPLOWO2_01_FULL_60_18 TaxID=1817768 RepID=A0A1F6TXM1_9PROT|nr:MAG: dihydropteroate synthase [Candidatus Muproteobacteria bacterium RIFCSPHIGHO2_01_60_12]OGI49819.1 MAG: dihydropteroate synthase [Candidatus Muproteobacteria bacterium RIFCSPLOWO2_01_FULL_60_18]OGI53816.1 MAG: dihydropteroate synthase [Candidatus Muproteobacteria bacterium RIFCSPHIGHO2_02_FULL_60_13]OGI54754.1 MAG: dihydropteroate synthase [Candidatus Muproteobacteria bacterium RIFCSPHIGHO2_12_FULL_60_33]OGI60216.1 MAG: dihydropteroate synthase [Candidatus Muproteobacteria bacterium RIFCS
MTFLDCGGRKLDLSRPAVMGILNVTPDSFSDGGVFLPPEKAIVQALRMAEEGADIIDIGGESTRPGARPVSAPEEIDRVLPVVEALHRQIPLPISIDTSKPEVMRAAVKAGAGFINDVRALREPGALETATQLEVPVCLMHMQGEPHTMQDDPRYADVVGAVRDFLKERLDACMNAGIPASRLVVDPGFGFGKTLEHNIELLRGLKKLQILGAPVLVGLSRKSMIGKALGLPVEQRLHASVALAVMAVQNGARIVRVHDVGPTVEALRMWSAVYPEY